MGGACSAYVAGELRVQGLRGKRGGKRPEETQVWMGG